MRHLLILLFSILFLQARADYVERYWNVQEAYDFNSKQSNPVYKTLPDAKFIRLWLYSIPESGLRETLKLDLLDKKNSNNLLATIWFTLGKSSYDFTYVDDNGKPTCLLTIYSSDFDNYYLGLTTDSRHSDGCTMVYISETSGLCTEVYIPGAQGGEFFKTVARIVRDLKFPKKRSDTLYIDVDF